MTYKTVRGVGYTALGILLGVLGTGGALRLPHLASGTVAMAAADTIATGNIREMETESGNMVADAVRDAAGTEIALVPAAAFKPGASAPRPATAEQATALLEVPTDEVVILSLRGAQILSALELSVAFEPQPSAGFLQVSGLKYSYNIGKPGGQRVGVVTLSNGTPLEAAKTYKVATTRPMANGQQGYFRVWERDQVSEGTGKSLSAALTVRATKTGKPLSSGIEGRITRAGQ